MGTRNRHARSAIWKPLYIDPVTTNLSMVRPNNINAINYRLTSTIKTRELSLATQLPNLVLTRNKITHDSLQILRTLNLQHHVYKTTWEDYNLITFTRE